MALKLSPAHIGSALGLAFGILLRIVISYRADGVFQLMTISFLFIAPMGLGALVVSRLPEEELRWGTLFTAPIPTVLAYLCVTAVLGWEGAICILMVSPVAIGMAIVGSLVQGWVRKGSGGLQSNVLLALLVVGPFVLTPIESRLDSPLRLETVENSIAIRASPNTVWTNIARVPAIRPDEHRPTWFHRIGFPRPIEATLSHEGVGGVRHASFEGNLLFIETVSEWKPNESLAFSIDVDPNSTPTTTLDQHVNVGGPFFDVLDGRYWLERRGPDDLVLHLSSTHRVSTHFNLYAGLWTRFVMGDVQQYILEVIKARCEAGPRATT